MRPKTIEALIRDHYDGMSPQVQRAAKHILSSPAEVAMYPMRQIARNADVSTAALARLATSIGYESFNALRDEFREEISKGRGAERYAVTAQNIILGDQEERKPPELEQLLAALLARTGEQFSPELLDKIRAAGEIFSHCRRVYIVGFRNNHANAFFFYYVTSLVRKGVILAEGRYGMTYDELREVGPDDAALIISFEPYVVDAVRCAEMVHAAGASVVALTDSVVSPIAKNAKVVLTSPNIGVGFYQSSIPSMAILEGITYEISRNAGAAGVELLSDRFSRLTDAGIYWTEPASRRR